VLRFVRLNVDVKQFLFMRDFEGPLEGAFAKQVHEHDTCSCRDAFTKLPPPELSSGQCRFE